MYTNPVAPSLIHPWVSWGISSRILVAKGASFPTYLPGSFLEPARGAWSGHWYFITFLMGDNFQLSLKNGYFYFSSTCPSCQSLFCYVPEFVTCVTSLFCYVPEFVTCVTRPDQTRPESPHWFTKRDTGNEVASFCEKKHHHFAFCWENSQQKVTILQMPPHFV